MIFNTPQVIMIIMWALTFLIHLAKDGQPYDASIAKYNASMRIVAIAIQFGLLYWGGFFG